MKELFSSLTKRELVLLLDFVQRCLRIDTDEGLKELLFELRDLIPGTHVIAGLGERDPLTFSHRIIKLLNVSYPISWVELYMERDYAEVDPIVHSHFKRFGTQVWTETFQRATTDREREFIEHAKLFGLSEGITSGIPCRKHGVGSIFSVAGVSMADTLRYSGVLEFLIPHLHVALMRAVFPSSSMTASLSLREQEVLKWMKEGKTSWEISQILHISERTVNFHVQNILEKLHASTRGHAIALAMEQGLIAP